jgi:putative alpha-1,2-mannosidase
MLKHLKLAFLFCLVAACDSDNSYSVASKLYTDYVNPFIGTAKMGHVFPGATAPFGMVQLSPQTNFELMFEEDGSYNTSTYEYCAGYQYRDTTILGFAHTNFSGTGHSDLGDLLLMPTTGPLD